MSKTPYKAARRYEWPSAASTRKSAGDLTQDQEPGGSVAGSRNPGFYSQDRKSCDYNAMVEFRINALRDSKRKDQINKSRIVFNLEASIRNSIHKEDIYNEVPEYEDE